MNKKMLNLTVLFLAFIAFVGALYATWTVVSPTITIVVTNYNLTISATPATCRINETITFSGNLTLNGEYVEDKTVQLYINGSVATGYSNKTDNVGFYSIVWPATENGTFSFYTQVVIDS